MNNYEIICLLSVARTALNYLIEDLKDESVSLTIDDIEQKINFAKGGIDFALKAIKEDLENKTKLTDKY